MPRDDPAGAALTTTPSVSPAEFLAWEEKQELRWEFDGAQPVPMTGVTAAHATVNMNLIAALGTRLRGKPCRVYGPFMKVSVGHGKYRYPDASVTCTPLAPRDDLLTEPVVLFEVLSESTQHTDKTEKLIEYRAIPTMRRYVMLEQDQVLATVIARTDTGWSLDMLRAGETLSLPEIGIEVPMDELYEGLTFDPRP